MNEIRNAIGLNHSSICLAWKNFQKGGEEALKSGRRGRSKGDFRHLLKFAYERKPEIVKKWLEVDYPQISARAKAEKAEIYWGDETGLRSGDVRGRGYSPKGQTPIINATAKYENLSMVSAITNKGRVHLKYGVGSKVPSRSKKDLTNAAEEHLQMLNSSPERIVKYFNDPAISYAAT